jgi:hypothetical protein
MIRASPISRNNAVFAWRHLACNLEAPQPRGDAMLMLMRLMFMTMWPIHIT